MAIYKYIFEGQTILGESTVWKILWLTIRISISYTVLKRNKYVNILILI